MSDDCCNRNVLMVHLPTESPTDLDLQRGERAGPCPGRKGCVAHKGATFQTCWSSVHAIGHSLPLVVSKPSSSLPNRYWHSLGTDRTAAPSRAKVRAHWEPSDKVLGDVLTTFLNVVHHQAQDRQQKHHWRERWPGTASLGTGAKSSIPQAMARGRQTNPQPQLGIW